MLDYLKKSKKLIQLYIKQNDQRLTFPEIFIPIEPPAPIQSPLRWEGKKSELYELIIALDLIGIISEESSQAPYSHLVRYFSIMLGLPYDDDCHNERKRILSRNTHKTVFVDKLKKFLNDKTID